MRVIDIRQAEAQLSRLVDEASKGDSFVIAIEGNSMVKVVALSAPIAASARRFGFLAGLISVPDDFDRMGADEIAVNFEL